MSLPLIPILTGIDLQKKEKIYFKPQCEMLLENHEIPKSRKIIGKAEK